VRKLDSAAAAAAASAAGAPFVEWKWGNGWQCRMNEALDVTTVDNMSATRLVVRRGEARGQTTCSGNPMDFFIDDGIYMHSIRRQYWTLFTTSSSKC